MNLTRMRFRGFRRVLPGLLIMGLLFSTGQAQSGEYTVTNSGFSAYVIDGLNNPALTLVRGQTYVFHINTPGHPFWIKTTSTTGSGNAWSAGVTGNGTQSGDLTFSVPADTPDQLYYICQFHSAMTGTITITGTAGSGPESGLLPPETGLLPNYPNPFNAATRIEFRLSATSPVRLEITSLQGRWITSLVDRTAPAGKYSVLWNGTDSYGYSVPSGMYLVHLSTGNQYLIRKIMLVK